jgi:hypothetical protein
MQRRCYTPPILTWGGMGKCYKYLYAFNQTFTCIMALKVMNMSMMCPNITITLRKKPL